jgi:hypothetical protein
VRGCGALPQHRVRLLGHILDLNTWHGAIMAPLALDRNRPTFGK